jgi:hypothetical protein
MLGWTTGGRTTRRRTTGGRPTGGRPTGGGAHGDQANHSLRAELVEVPFDGLRAQTLGQD